MPRLSFSSRLLAALAATVLTVSITDAQSVPSVPSIAPWLSPASPLTLISAAKADRIAWMTYDQGLRNIYTAAAPDFRPVRATRFLKDDGTDLTDLNISDDGSVIVFVRGSAPNRFGWVANPAHDARGAERAIWAVRSSGGTPWRIAEGAAPVLSPDGRWVLFVRDGQIHRARVTRASGATLTAMDTGGVPLIRAWGRNSSPKWSPDGSRIAFVSDRENHSFVVIYDVAKRTVTYVSPSVDCDGTPSWSPDGRSLAFSRRPGVPFGLQAQRGSGGIGNPAGPAANPQAPVQPGNPSGGCGGGFGFGFGLGQPQSARQDTSRGSMRRSPGFYSAAFHGGHTLKLMVADAATGMAREVWHNASGDSVFTNLNNMVWAGDRIAFPVNVPRDEWQRWYALPLDGGAPERLTTTDGLIEDATSVAFSRDGGRTLFYCTNAEDIESGNSGRYL